MYSDAFIVENAFQPKSNDIPFDLTKQHWTDNISTKKEPKLVKTDITVPVLDADTVKKQMKQTMDLDMPMREDRKDRFGHPTSPVQHESPLPIYEPGTVFPQVPTKPVDKPWERPGYTKTDKVPTSYYGSGYPVIDETQDPEFY